MSKSVTNASTVPRTALVMAEAFLVYLRTEPTTFEFAQALVEVSKWLEYPATARNAMLEQLKESFISLQCKNERAYHPLQAIINRHIKRVPLAIGGPHFWRVMWMRIKYRLWVRPFVEVGKVRVRHEDLQMLAQVCRLAPRIAATGNLKLIEAFADTFHNFPSDIHRRNFDRSEFVEFVLRSLVKPWPNVIDEKTVEAWRHWSVSSARCKSE